MPMMNRADARVLRLVGQSRLLLPGGLKSADSGPYRLFRAHRGHPADIYPTEQTGKRRLQRPAHERHIQPPQ